MAKAKAEAAPAYTKAQLLASRRYAERRDLLCALLADGETYTVKQADALIQKYLKGCVN